MAKGVCFELSSWNRKRLIMPINYYERITEPAEDYPVVHQFLLQGFEETARLLAELEGSKWFKIALAIDTLNLEPNWQNVSHAYEETWHDIIASGDYHPIDSGGSLGDGCDAGSNNGFEGYH